MAILGITIFWICQVYTLILVARVILDIVQVLARDWYPRGVLLVLANMVYRLTNPPLRFLGRFIPTLNFGGVGIDFGFLVLFIAVQIVQQMSLVLV
ncbi:YggT family protein [Trueperella sp. LYQ143]|uniref:YggT family protein n=1 Tax=unclassified Trueperella TaxID=2630174 RepID=UPI0039833615